MPLVWEAERVSDNEAVKQITSEGRVEFISNPANSSVQEETPIMISIKIVRLLQ